MASSSAASSSSSLAWYWVLEALADLKQIEPPLLKRLLSNLPNLFEEAPDSVKERLALRYLEECGTRGVVGAKNKPAGTIDVANSSEEVLCTNLTKVVDLSKSVQSRKEIINHDLRQFISQKQATLPKLSLDLVKESALKGKIPKLPSINGNDTSSNQEQECNNAIEEHEMVISPKSTDGTHILQEHPGTGNGLQKDPSDADVILQKGPSDTGFILHKGPSDPDTTSIEHNNSPLIENNLVTEAPTVTNSEANENIEPSSDDTNNFIFQKRVPAVSKISLQELKESILQSDIPNLPSVNEIGNKEQERVNLQKGPSISANLSDAHTAFEEPNIVSDKNPNENVQNENPNLGPNIVPETSSGTNDLSDNPFASEKARLLSSQLKMTQDSFKMTEQNMCIKCDKGGQLLNCMSEDCVISVHETCLGGTTPNNFDKNGYFYCPFCAYSKAARVYNKAKKDFFHARKYLSLFLSKDNKINDTNRNNQYEENRGINDKGKKAISTEDRDNNDNNDTYQKQEKRDTNLRVEELDKYRYFKSKDPIGGTNGSSESGSRDEESENKRREEERENKNKRRIEEERKDGERENYKRRRATPRYVNPVATPGRRNKLTWSSEEEEALREGMQKFGAPLDGKIPWREILEFRRHVFDKTRLPGDLKDKWRNMMKKEGSRSHQK